MVRPHSWRNIAISLIIPAIGHFECNGLLTAVIFWHNKIMRKSGLFAFVALTVSLYPQGIQHPTPDWSPKSKQAAEDAIAQTVDQIRRSAGFPALRRVTPSRMDIQLVCTAAVTGRKVHDPLFAGLQTYLTNDPSAETEALKEITLERPKKGKEYSRYSVVVVRNANTSAENPTFTVGVARRPSASLEFFAPLFLDVPFKGMNEWKKEVAPECRNQKD